MKSLFAYGSLQFPEVMRAVTGLSPAGVSARLEGYRRCRIRGRSYPGVLAFPGACCDGVLYRNLPDEAWSLLDDFEDDFYRRRGLAVSIGGTREPAEVYVVAEECLGMLLDEDWDPGEFRERSLQRFLRDHS